MIHLRSVSLDAPDSDAFPFDVPAIRAMREMGATWRILTPQTPQPAGLHKWVESN